MIRSLEPCLYLVACISHKKHWNLTNQLALIKIWSVSTWLNDLMYSYEWKHLCIPHEHDSIEGSWGCSGGCLGDFKFPADHTSDCRSLNRLGFEMHRIHFAMLIWSNYKKLSLFFYLFFCPYPGSKTSFKVPSKSLSHASQFSRCSPL